MATQDDREWWQVIADFFGVGDGASNSGTIPWETLLALLGGVGAAEGWFGSVNPPKIGYQGKIPEYTAVRERVPREHNPFRPAGAAGRYYFSPTYFAEEGGEEAAKTQASNESYIRKIMNDANNQGISALYAAMGSQYTPYQTPLFAPPPATSPLPPYPEQMPAPPPPPMTGLPPYVPPELGTPIEGQNPNLPPPTTPAPTPTGPGVPGKGSPGPAQVQTQTQQQTQQMNDLLAALQQQQQSVPLQGRGSPSYRYGGVVDMARPQDGMGDNIPAMINGKQPANLSGGEFVVPADVVSHLGNGNTNAGASKLKEMMMEIRKARTGSPSQGRRINPNSFMPRG